MVAYSFNGRFVPAILAGRKRQTIRGHRKRHARPGEEMQLFTGMRTRSCKLLARPICAAVRDIEIDICPDHGITSIEIDGIAVASLDGFAVLDRFEPILEGPRIGTALQAMSEFWALAHGCRRFSGVLLEWSPLLPFQQPRSAA